jgi:hypothetical protein
VSGSSVRRPVLAVAVAAAGAWLASFLWRAAEGIRILGRTGALPPSSTERP